MKSEKQSKLNSNLLLVFGALLLLWGITGAVGTIRTGLLSSGDEESPDDGFVPYYVPVQEDNSEENIILQGPPDQTPEAEAAAGTNSAGPEGIDPQSLIDQEIITAKPERIVISKISLDAPIVDAMVKKTYLAAEEYEQWLAPDEFAAGWHTTSAKLGEVGNTVLNGHHNVHGMVFKDLVKLETGDEIIVYGGGHEFRYEIVNKMILPERDVTAEVRLENARWIMHSTDERLTLVTCWPYESNTHRLVIVARPIE